MYGVLPSGGVAIAGVYTLGFSTNSNTAAGPSWGTCKGWPCKEGTASSTVVTKISTNDAVTAGMGAFAAHLYIMNADPAIVSARISHLGGVPVERLAAADQTHALANIKGAGSIYNSGTAPWTVEMTVNNVPPMMAMGSLGVSTGATITHGFSMGLSAAAKIDCATAVEIIKGYKFQCSPATGAAASLLVAATAAAGYKAFFGYNNQGTGVSAQAFATELALTPTSPLILAAASAITATAATTAAPHRCEILIAGMPAMGTKAQFDAAVAAGTLNACAQATNTACSGNYYFTHLRYKDANSFYARIPSESEANLASKIAIVNFNGVRLESVSLGWVAQNAAGAGTFVHCPTLSGGAGFKQQVRVTRATQIGVLPAGSSADTVTVAGEPGIIHMRFMTTTMGIPAGKFLQFDLSAVADMLKQMNGGVALASGGSCAIYGAQWSTEAGAKKTTTADVMGPWMVNPLSGHDTTAGCVLTGNVLGMKLDSPITGTVDATAGQGGKYNIEYLSTTPFYMPHVAGVDVQAVTLLGKTFPFPVKMSVSSAITAGTIDWSYQNTPSDATAGSDNADSVSTAAYLPHSRGSLTGSAFAVQDASAGVTTDIYMQFTYVAESPLHWVAATDSLNIELPSGWTWDTATTCVLRLQMGGAVGGYGPVNPRATTHYDGGTQLAFTQTISKQVLSLSMNHQYHTTGIAPLGAGGRATVFTKEKEFIHCKVKTPAQPQTCTGQQAKAWVGVDGAAGLKRVTFTNPYNMPCIGVGATTASVSSVGAAVAGQSAQLSRVEAVAASGLAFGVIMFVMMGLTLLTSCLTCRRVGSVGDSDDSDESGGGRKGLTAGGDSDELETSDEEDDSDES